MIFDTQFMTYFQVCEIAMKYYDKETYYHAYRVANYVYENNLIPTEYRSVCVQLAIMHDLLEDTEYDGKDLPEDFKKALDILTKPKEMSYDDYCKNIKNTNREIYKEWAYWVKLADIKDHLSLTDTLTNKLKEKYLSGLRYLL